MNKFFFILFLIVFGFQNLFCQSLEISGNGLVIQNDGSNEPRLSDGTDFGNLKIGERATNTFLLTNLDSSKPDLEIRSIFVNSTDFEVNSKRKIKIKPGRSEAFEIVYQPQSGGTHAAQVRIIARRDGVSITYAFNIIGESVSNIMISQFYENGSDDAIEVKNLSGGPIGSGSFFVGIYEKQNDLKKGPGEVLDLGAFDTDEVKVYRLTDWFEGSEVVVLSTSGKKSCYDNRVDILGVHGSNWGSGRSLTKGACSSESAHLEFDPGDWTELSIGEVDSSDSRQNIYLGRHDGNPLIWDGSTWSDNGLPDRTRKVLIAGTFTSDLGGLETCDLEVEGELNFNTGTKNSVVIHGDLKISGDFSLGDAESLVMYDPLAEIQGEIVKHERSTYRNNAHDFTYWSSPVANESVSRVFDGVTSSRIFYYDQSQSESSDVNHPDYWKTWRTANGSMVPTLGYAAEGPRGTTGYHDLQFRGSPNNGNIFAPVYSWNDGDSENDWNLIGNPYPSAIDIERFFDANQGIIDPAIYLWTHATPISGGDSGDYAFDDYATYNYTGGTGIGQGVGDGPIPEKNIGSAQAFFVRALSSGNAIFTNEMRLVDANDQFFKQERVKEKKTLESGKDRIWLNLTNDQGGFSQLLLGFFDQAGPEVDPGYDAKRFEGGNLVSFYSKIGQEKFVIQARNTFSTDKKIPVGFSTQAAPRTFSIEIAKTEGALSQREVYLRDLKTGALHDLSKGAYHFQVEEAGDQPDRFMIEFAQETSLFLDEEIETKNLEVYSSEESIIVRSADVVKEIRIHNLLGALIFESTPGEKRFEIHLPGPRKGEILLIDVYDQKGLKRSKKIIRR